MRKLKMVKEWREGIVERWPKIKNEIVFTSKRLIILGVIAVVLYVVYTVLFHWLIYPLFFSVNYHVFVASKMDIVQFKHETEMTHVMGCPCTFVDAVHAKQGFLIHNDGSVVFSLANIIFVQEMLLKANTDKTSFVVPKMWKAEDTKDMEFMAKSEFNPCILSLRKESGAIIHLLNPVMIHALENVEKRKIVEKSSLFLYANAIEVERDLKVKLRAMEYEHKSVKTWEPSDPKMVILIQHAMDILNGAIVPKLVPLEKKEEPTPTSTPLPGFKRIEKVYQPEGKNEDGSIKYVETIDF